MSHALQQSDEYLRALRRIGAGAQRVGDDVVQSRRVPPFGTVRLITRGTCRDLLDLSRCRGPVLLTPETGPPPHCLRLFPGTTFAVLQLGDETAMRRAMHQKWRNRLNRAANLGVRADIACFDSQRHAGVLRRDLDQQRRRRYRALPHVLVHAYARVNPGKVQVVDTGDAAMIFLLHGSSATYVLGTTTEPGRARHAHTACLWLAMRQFTARGIARIDLGRTDLTHGIRRFKLGTGAAERPLPGTYLWLPSVLPRYRPIIQRPSGQKA